MPFAKQNKKRLIYWNKKFELTKKKTHDLSKYIRWWKCFLAQKKLCLTILNFKKMAQRLIFILEYWTVNRNINSRNKEKTLHDFYLG